MTHIHIFIYIYLYWDYKPLTKWDSHPGSASRSSPGVPGVFHGSRAQAKATPTVAWDDRLPLKGGKVEHPNGDLMGFDHEKW